MGIFNHKHILSFPQKGVHSFIYVFIHSLIHAFIHSFIFLLKILSKIPYFTGPQKAWPGQQDSEDTNWCHQQSILFPCGYFCFKWISIFSIGQRAFITPVFTDQTPCQVCGSDTRNPPVRSFVLPRPWQCFSNDISPWLHSSIPSCWSMRQIPGLDTCKEIIHMISSLFLTLFKKCNKTLQYYQHDSMLFLDFKVSRLDVLMICSGATFIRQARAPLASTSERRRQCVPNTTLATTLPWSQLQNHSPRLMELWVTQCGRHCL